MTAAITGHRPKDLFGYDLMAPGYARIREAIKQAVTNCGVTGLWTGMALGIDQLAALAILDLNDGRPENNKIKLHAAIPCRGHAKGWPEQSQLLYQAILSKCDDMTLVTDEDYSPWLMQKRNIYMCDRSGLLIAVWSGKDNGGTYNCIQYAKKKGMPILCIDPNDPDNIRRM